MANPLSAYRVYLSNYSSFESLRTVRLRKEIHVVLAFARDYDSAGRYTKGEFHTYFNKDEITANAIADFKANSSSRVKFFLSIGSRNPKYPFLVKPADKANWIERATASLKIIIGEYGLDGLDVYYQHIDPQSGGQFVDAIGQVLENLRNDGDISQASITVSAPLCDNYYYPLFNRYKTIIDNVVYQTHTWLTVVETPQALENEVLKKLPYPKEKRFAGHSVLATDWITVPLPIFVGAVPHLLHDSQLVSGISNWLVTSDDPDQN